MDTPELPIPLVSAVIPNSSWVYSKNTGIRTVSGISSALSICGSLLIILSYLCFRELRTRARLILVHLAISDMGVGVANLTGILINFSHYFFVHGHVVKNNTVMENLCISQAFIAEYCTLCSMLWTTCLAAYMYLLIVNKSTKQIFMWFSYVFCYVMPLIVTVWLELTRRLGYAPYDSSGWCSIIVIIPHDGKYTIDIFSGILGYDLWIILTLILILVLYVSVYCYTKQKYHELKQLSAADGSIFWKTMYNIDYKFIMIPLMFVFLRIWTLIIDIVLVYMHIPQLHIKHWILEALFYLAGVGDSGQGFVNAILFVAFAPKVRKKLFCCIPRLRRRIISHPKSAFLFGRSADPTTHKSITYHVTDYDSEHMEHMAPSTPQPK